MITNTHSNAHAHAQAYPTPVSSPLPFHHDTFRIPSPSSSSSSSSSSIPISIPTLTPLSIPTPTLSPSIPIPISIPTPMSTSTPPSSSSSTALSIPSSPTSIDTEIAHVQSSILALIKHHAHLKQRRNSYAPIMALPLEVLGLIFEFACMGSSPGTGSGTGEGMGESSGLNLDGLEKDRDAKQSTSHPTPRSSPPRSRIILSPGALSPLFLGTICRAWRAIAWDAAHLWSTLKLRLDDTRALAQAEMVRDWLGRSKQRLLNITLLEDFPPSDSDSEADDNDINIDNDLSSSSSVWHDTTSTAVIQVLAEHSHRWATLDILVPHAYKSVLSQIRHRMPHLTTLRLRISENSPSLSYITSFAYTPQLKRVALVGYAASDVELPWKQLESFEGDYYSAGECVDTIRQCTALRSVQFEQMYRGVVDPFTAFGGAGGLEMVNHALLHSFELVLDSDIELRGVFETLTLPSLRTLIVSVPSQSQSQPSTPTPTSVLGLIMGMLTRSGSAGTLEKLHLVSTIPDEACLVKSLRELKGLRTLLLLDPAIGEEQEGGITDLVLDWMHPWKWRKRNSGSGSGSGSERGSGSGEGDGEEGCMLPKLQHFEYSGGVAFHGRTFVDLLSGRWGPISTRAPMERRSLVNAAFLIGKPYPASALRKVVVTTSRRISFKAEERDVLSLLKADGMDIELCVESPFP
ncbi:hypothetical protein CVT24_004434 [Panaeolus cyanescens]|uniref:F-box domain-containing protein n=1 Tax=Panaeolus cyanescens TaxID=181874 RepID=A0A409VE08_9AGAR|nr:hypothetical protein CVT24_004434 [Panaeolus cyanescens]